MFDNIIIVDLTSINPLFLEANNMITEPPITFSKMTKNLIYKKYIYVPILMMIGATFLNFMVSSLVPKDLFCFIK